jgi:hypothetical protein
MMSDRPGHAAQAYGFLKLAVLILQIGILSNLPAGLETRIFGVALRGDKTKSGQDSGLMLGEAA